MSLEKEDLLNFDDDPPLTLKPSSQKLEDDDTGIPLAVAKCIALNLSSIGDLLNFSLVSKNCHDAVYLNDDLWVAMLRILELWDTRQIKSPVNGSEADQLKRFETMLNPMNCFNKDNIILHKTLAFPQFKAIYRQINPIFKDLIIVNRSNFANSKFLKQYNDPESQVIIFNNLTRFMNIYQDLDDFKNFSVRLNTIVDIFTNSVLKEIETNLNLKNYKECLRFVRVASTLNANGVSTTLDLVLEFFIDRYIEDFNFLNQNETINSCFFKTGNNPTKINYENLSEIFKQVKEVLTREFNEVSSIFNSDPSYKASSDEINEVPIILKIIENFLQNVLISKFLEELVAKASYIDEQEENFEATTNISNEGEGRSEDVLNEDIEKKEQDDEEEEEEKEQEDASEVNEWSDIPTSKPPAADVSSREASPISKLEKESGVEEMSNAALYFQIVPYLYRKIIELFDTLEYPVSVPLKSSRESRGSVDSTHSEAKNQRKASASSLPIDYKKISVELVDFYYEAFLSEFIEKLPKQCNVLLKGIVNQWKSNQRQQEVSQTSQILNLVTSSDSKNKNFLKLDIFTGFSKIFKVGNTVNMNEVENSQHKAFTKNEANLKILTANLNNIKSLISLDLAITLLKTLKENTQLLLSLTGRGASKKPNPKKKVGEYSPLNGYHNEDIQHRVNITCQEMFNDMLNILMEAHIREGFDKALTRLRTYKPSDLKNSTDNTVDPIINFIELVNVGDLIQQMVSVFYREELVNAKIVVQRHKTKRDFLMANKCEKSMKKFESLLDNYVADGLNISIDVLMSEISYGIMTALDGADFNITEKHLVEKNINLGEPSKLAQRVLGILENHVNLLTGSIDKTIVDVFQQEIGERFVTILVKLITKDLTISTTGAVILISDLNAYYNFFLKLKIKPVLAYFTALKSISQLYLIEASNSKDIGKLVVKIGRENGIFNQEEIYEFVTRRSDWDLIKRDVDKIMYGLGLTDCVII